MILGIDASNIRAGGGLTHLRQLLDTINFTNNGFHSVVVWSSDSTLKKLPDHEWLVKKTHRSINKNSISTLLWQIFSLSNDAKKEKCSLIFVPGGTFLSTFRPYVAMSQNMLPFESKEASRYKSRRARLRFKVLRLTQSFTFKHAAAMIFISSYAQKTITKIVGINKKPATIIPHGINTQFLNAPREQKEISSYSYEQPLKILYVSIVSAYKHQWNVAEAVIELRREGFPIELHLVGPLTHEGYPKLQEVLNRTPDWQTYITIHGSVPYEELAGHYKNCDLFVFASSCENQPIILLEAMSAGLPIACSNKGPMPEVLKNNGAYFDPEDHRSIKKAIQELMENKEVRKQCASGAFEEVKNYTWQQCAERTFSYLHEIAVKNQNNGYEHVQK